MQGRALKITGNWSHREAVEAVGVGGGLNWHFMGLMPLSELWGPGGCRPQPLKPPNPINPKPLGSVLGCHRVSWTLELTGLPASGCIGLSN